MAWKYVSFTVRPHPGYYPALPDGAVLSAGHIVGDRLSLYVPEGADKAETISTAANVAKLAYGILAENPRIRRK